MNDTNELPPLDVRALLRRHGLSPKKGLGQNFLVDPLGLARVVEAAEISASDAVLEVGPGLGGLTRHLAQRARRVVAVEIDERFIPPLAEVLAPFPNVDLVRGDVLALDPAALMGESGYLVVANIPYYITSAVVRHLLEASRRPDRLVLTVQREVAQRICAGPGKMSLLALSVQVYGRPQVVARIPAGAFYPRPKVDSSVVRVEIYDQPQVPEAWLALFFRLAKAGFSQRRKMLRNALAAGLGWPREQTEALLVAAAIDPGRRAQSLDLQDWIRLVAAYVQRIGVADSQTPDLSSSSQN